jgi:primosomal replication protein N
VIEFRIAHASEQVEAGQPRQVDCEIGCVAVGPVALLLKDAQPGTGIGVSGFLAARSLKQKALVLHATAIEFAEIE